MKKPLRVGSWMVGALLFALLALTLEVARFGGVFTAIHPSFAGTCQSMALAGSVEDVQVDGTRGLAYLSFLDRASLARGEPQNGTVMLMDLNVPEPAVRAALAYDPPDFRPHGMSLLARPGEPSRLFAISHRSDGTHTVELAEEAATGGLVPRETIRDAAFTHPNAIAAAGPRQFYLVNDSIARSRTDQAREAVFRRGSGTLYYYDGKTARLEADGLKFPAGLALSPDGAHLYVGEVFAKALRIYRRDPANGALALEETVALGTSPDNLDIDAAGIVWIAAQPKLLAFFAHLRDPGKHAPTQVLTYDPRREPRLLQVYLGDGAEISGGTVAAAWRDEFLIGALLDRKVLVCQPNR